jgi:hypothetical protein
MKPVKTIGILSILAGLALIATTFGTAEAGGPKVMVGPTPWKGQMGQFHPQRPNVRDTPPSQVTLPRHAFPVHPIRPPFGPPYGGRVYPYPGYPYPSYGYGCCAYSAPSYETWVPGYWAYQFVPQGSSTSTWVPGYYDADGVWVAGYYSSQTVQGGYYQPYWVPGYWSP